MSGTLFVVATPIGNLEDLSARALRVLREADAIACEDTRVTARILNAHGLHKPMISYYQPREGRRIPRILEMLEAGKSVALVSDAGTPGLSDPGFRLVRAAVERGIKVVTVPGPTAMAAALAGSALPTNRFLFLGFPPPKDGATRKLLASVKSEAGTLIFYLPARRVQAFLGLVLEELGDRRVVIARELTKIYEEFIRGTAAELGASLAGRELKGEVTFLIHGAGK